VFSFASFSFSKEKEGTSLFSDRMKLAIIGGRHAVSLGEGGVETVAVLVAEQGGDLFHGDGGIDQIMRRHVHFDPQEIFLGRDARDERKNLGIILDLQMGFLGKTCHGHGGELLADRDHRLANDPLLMQGEITILVKVKADVGEEISHQQMDHTLNVFGRALDMRKFVQQEFGKMKQLIGVSEGAHLPVVFFIQTVGDLFSQRAVNGKPDAHPRLGSVGAHGVVLVGLGIIKASSLEGLSVKGPFSLDHEIKDKNIHFTIDDRISGRRLIDAEVKGQVLGIGIIAVGKIGAVIRRIGAGRTINGRL